MSLWSDLRYGVRLLLRSPGFAFAAVSTLALGIGGGSTIFSVVNGVLLRPLPYADPERIVIVYDTSPNDQRGAHAPANFVDLHRDSRAFEYLSAYREDVYDLAEAGTEPQRLEGTQVTAAFFDVFGLGVVQGRTIHAYDKPGDRLGVLSERTWRRVYGADPSVVGRTVRLNGEPVTIIGVVPASFRWPSELDVWVLADKDVPSSPLEQQGEGSDRGLRYFSAIGRLAPGVSFEEAQADVAAIGRRIAEAFPTNNRDNGLRIASMQEEVIREVRPGILLLFGAVGFVLLIACANVANLLLARAAGRTREIAVRSSLGATRTRLVRQLLAESLVLATLGGILGLIVARWGIDLLAFITPETFPRLAEVDVDTNVLLFTAVLTLGSGILFGLVPAVETARTEVADALKSGARGSSEGRSRRLRSVLVVGQVALALIVLIGAGLLISSFLRLQRVNAGFAAEEVLALELILPQARYPKAVQQARFYAALHERLAELPATSASALVFPLPLGEGTDSSASFRRIGRDSQPENERVLALLSSVSPGYFRSMSIPLVSGRDFTPSDGAEQPRVMIISAEMAKRYWPNEDPVGTLVNFGAKEPATVVGVVGDVRRQDLASESKPTIYLPYEQFTIPFMNIVVRSSRGREAIVTDVRAAVREMDPELPLGDIQTMAQLRQRSVAEPRFRTGLLTIFGGVALLLAAVGVYGLISYSVSQRFREIGIRVALGSTPGEVLRLMIREGAMLSLVGIAIGLAAAFVLTRFLSSLLYGIGATDPLTFIVVSVVLGGVSVLATLLPARRAARIDPIEALRCE